MDAFALQAQALFQQGQAVGHFHVQALGIRRLGDRIVRLEGSPATLA